MNKNQLLMRSLSWLALCLVTALLIGRFLIIGATQKHRANPAAVKPSVTPLRGADSLVAWKLYRSQNYGFEIRYPADFSPNEITDITPVVVNGALVSIAMTDKKYFSGTNLREASIIIGARHNDEALSRCLKAEAGSLYKYKGGDLPKEEVNSIPFSRDFVEEGAAGHLYEKTSYRTIHKDACYEIALFIHSVNVGVRHPGTVSAFKRDEVMEKLHQVLSTFNFRP